MSVGDISGRPIDWVRYAAGILSRAMDSTGATWAPAGDPTRWGGRDRVTLPVLGEGASVDKKTQQLVRVQGADNYARNWQLLGNVTMPTDLWDLDSDALGIALQVTMGVGQNTVVQSFDLRALVLLAAPWYVSDGVTRPWVIAGGVLGNNINIQTVFSLAATLGAPTDVSVDMLMSPYSAGFGI